MELNESIQLDRKIEKFSISSLTHYGQFKIYLKDVRRYGYSHRSDAIRHGDYRSQQYNVPYRYNLGYQRDRSRSANCFQKYESWSTKRFRINSRNRYDGSHSPSCFCFGDRLLGWSTEYPHTDPSLRNMSCIGRSSSQYTLTDRKCTPSFEHIEGV